MNLVKELHKVAKENYQRDLTKAEELLDSVKSDLAEKDKQEEDLLKYFGTAAVIAEQNKKLAEIKKGIDEDYLTEDDIKSICIRYALRFLPAASYKKQIPKSALSDLRVFTDTITKERYNIGEKLYMIAPASHFTLGPRPKKDPILLYKVAEGIYKIISTWGNDFTFIRRIFGLFKANIHILFALIWILLTAIIIMEINIDELLTMYIGFVFFVLGAAAFIGIAEYSTAKIYNKPYN